MRTCPAYYVTLLLLFVPAIKSRFRFNEFSRLLGGGTRDTTLLYCAFDARDSSCSHNITPGLARNVSIYVVVLLLLPIIIVISRCNDASGKI